MIVGWQSTRPGATGDGNPPHKWKSVTSWTVSPRVAAGCPRVAAVAGVVSGGAWQPPGGMT